MFILADSMSFIWPIILLAVFGVIVVAVILVKRHVSVFKSDEKPKSDEEIAQEELNRILEPVEDLTPEEGKPEEPAKPENPDQGDAE